MTVNWSDPEVKDRILAAIVGSVGGVVSTFPLSLPLGSANITRPSSMSRR